jgi:hypothetical protein
LTSCTAPTRGGSRAANADQVSLPSSHVGRIEAVGFVSAAASIVRFGGRLHWNVDNACGGVSDQLDSWTGETKCATH